MPISYFPEISTVSDWGKISGAIKEQNDLIELIDDKIDSQLSEHNPAYYFNGINSEIKIAHNNLLNQIDGANDKPFSICCTYKAESFDDYHYLFAKGENTPEYALFIDLNGYVFFRLFSGNLSNYIDVRSDIKIILIKATNIVATYDGSGLASGLNIYINGYLHSGDRNSVNYTGKQAGNDDATIGRFTSFYAKGYIYDLAIFNKELDISEIQLFIQKGVVNYNSGIDLMLNIILEMNHTYAYPTVWIDISSNLLHGLCKNTEQLSLKSNDIAFSGVIDSNKEINDFIQGGYFIDKITINCINGSAEGKKVNIGTTIGGNEIIDAFELSSNTYFDASPITKFFDLETAIFINDSSTTTAWNNGTQLEFTVTFHLKRML